MRWLMIIFIGTGVTAAVAAGIIAFSYDPYQAGIPIKLLFFSGLGIVGISLIGLIYCLVRLLIRRFKRKE